MVNMMKDYINGEYDERLGLKNIGEIPTSNISDNNIFTLEELTMNYFKYNINYINNIPEFEYQTILFENTALGFPCQFLVVSNSPRVLIVNNGFDNLDLFLYSQKINSNMETFIKEITRKIAFLKNFITKNLMKDLYPYVLVLKENHFLSHIKIVVIFMSF